jgi:hypothetical protein
LKPCMPLVKSELTLTGRNPIINHIFPLTHQGQALILYAEIRVLETVIS